MEDFLKADGLSRIIFYFQEVDNIPDAGTLLTCLSRVHVSSVNNNQFFSLWLLRAALNLIMCDFSVEHVRLGPGGVQSATIKPRPKVFITDTRDMQLSGACVFFIKINPSKALTLANICQVIYLYTLSLYFDR